MAKKKIVLTGGPGGGKTTLIELLKAKGHICFDEISREQIERAKHNSHAHAFADNPIAFSQPLWKGRIRQYHDAQKVLNQENTAHVFFDRGLPDVVAYLSPTERQKTQWEDALNQYRYDLVFLLQPQRSFYQKDNQRMENYAEALRLHHSIKSVYEQLGPVIEVPFLSPADRLVFILRHCDDE